MTDPYSTVKTGYDKVSYAYREPSAPHNGFYDPSDVKSDNYVKYRDYVQKFYQVLPKEARVLDLGCGCGLPTSREITERGHDLTGVDISSVQINRARQYIPGAKFLCADMRGVTFSSASFDAILCLYAIIHVPKEEQQSVLDNIFEWLKPGGYLLLSVANVEWTGEEKDWCGVEGATMFWSHPDRKTYLEWLRKFTIIWEHFIPEGDDGHPLLLLQKPVGIVETV